MNNHSNNPAYCGLKPAQHDSHWIPFQETDSSKKILGLLLLLKEIIIPRQQASFSFPRWKLLTKQKF